jgi:serine/threonine-protein kinase
MTTWASGVRLGPYVLMSRIGVGGMAEVWKARDTRLDRIVAIKKLKPEHSQRFEQEARAIAALNHPHICQLYDIGPDYLVMEYVEGKPLHGPLPPEDASRLAIQIASALEEAHGKGILHRDLKPANIMVTDKGEAKLLDFGLARLVVSDDPDATRRTIEGTVMGTAAYMSPEQVEGRALDARSDVFSFGAVLYEMLSGNRAFEGNSTVQVVTAVLRDDPRPLGTESAFERIVMRCLAKHPGQRFQTMMELKAALEQVPARSRSLEPSIAVLPFANIGADKENEYFSDGLAEEIINALTHILGLKVTARTSAFAFRGKEQDIRKIAEALGVRAILEGSVRRAGNRIRVTAQLINAEDGYHLWSERYDRDMSDVFAMQDEIAQAIAAALQVKLGAAARPRRYTPKLPAYEALLKARYHASKLMPESLARSKEYFEQAIALDPQFAEAHSSFGVYFLTRAYSGLAPAHEAMPSLRAEARKALEIDPSLPEAHAMVGTVAAVYDYDWKEAGSRFQLAMAGDAIPPWVRGNYALFYLLLMGRPLEAVEELQRALKEDPLNLFLRTMLALCLLVAGRDLEASAELRQVLEIDEKYPIAYPMLAILHWSQGLIPEALAFAEKMHSLAPWIPMPIGALAGLLRLSGDTSRAEALLEKLRPGQAYAAPTGLAIFHLYCSEIDKAADWVEKAIEQRYPLILHIMRGPLGKALRSSARWPALARQMNLPDAG